MKKNAKSAEDAEKATKSADDAEKTTTSAEDAKKPATEVRFFDSKLMRPVAKKDA